MARRSYLLVSLVAFFVLIAGSVTPARAQLGFTVVGVGEFDTDDVYLALGSVTVAPRRTGWSPLASLTALWVQFPVSGTIAGSDEKQSVITVLPSVGVQNAFNGGAFQVRAGYAFSDRDEDDVLGVPAFTAEAGDDGVVTTAQVDYWGTGAWNAQAIATYNFGAEASWVRGRLGKRLFGVGDAGSLGIGAEAALLDSDAYGATKIGGVVFFNPGPGTQINAAIGKKLGRDDAGDATYFTFELVLFPH